ncbi:MAG: hypothetical protein ACKVQC_06660 [Elusimicrobiota bacterium]
MKFFVFLILFLFCIPVFSSDQIILNEGKSLYGKIISEDHEEVVLDIGANMILRVNKKKISKIVRSESVVEIPKKVITYHSQLESPKPIPSVQPDKLKPAQIELKSSVPVAAGQNQKITQSKKGVLTSNERIAKTEMAISAENFLEAQKKIEAQLKILESDAVVGTKNGQPVLTFSWTGNYRNQGSGFQWADVILDSSMTVRTLYWAEIKEASSHDLSLWMKYREDLNVYQSGFESILQKEIDSFAISMSNLIGVDEQELMAASNELFLKFKKNVVFRFRGYFRREQDKRARQKNKLTSPTKN